jgi:NADPH2:quinone reductase
MRRIATNARVAVCGQISQYNAVEPETGPRWLSQLIVRQAKVEGFLVSQFAPRFEDGLRQLSTWLKEKRLVYREDVVDGLENAPRAFIRMMQGKNIGKQLVKVSA